jgi:prepilin-type N-terminal cleavage/methylation domain-containing protein
LDCGFYESVEGASCLYYNILVSTKNLLNSWVFKPFSQNRMRGLTLIELSITIAIIGALAVFAVVAMTSAISSFKFNSAVAQVMFDIRYAQHLARTRNGWYGIRFQIDPVDEYNVYHTDGATDTNVTDPANTSEDLVVDVNSNYDRVTISAVNIAGGNKVEFNPVGTPYDDMAGSPLAATGTVTLSLGGSTKVIQIIKNTGRVELQ